MEELAQQNRDLHLQQTLNQQKLQALEEQVKVLTDALTKERLEHNLTRRALELSRRTSQQMHAIWDEVMTNPLVIPDYMRADDADADVHNQEAADPLLQPALTTGTQDPGEEDQEDLDEDPEEDQEELNFPDHHDPHDPSNPPHDPPNAPSPNNRSTDQPPNTSTNTNPNNSNTDPTDTNPTNS